MRKKEINSLDRLETSGRESGRTTVKAGRKSYLSKSSKASSQPRRRQGNEWASDGKKQRGGQPRPVFKISDHLSDEIIEKLRAEKEAEKENGRTNLKRSTSRK